MAVIPINEAVAADLARRGVYPLDRFEHRVPDEWLALLEQMNGSAGSPLDRSPNRCDGVLSRAADPDIQSSHVQPLSHVGP